MFDMSKFMRSPSMRVVFRINFGKTNSQKSLEQRLLSIKYNLSETRH